MNKMSDVFEFIHKNEFANLPILVTKILELLKSKDADNVALINLIESDTLLKDKILKICNSNFLSLDIEVQNISQAIEQTSNIHISNIAIGVSIFSEFSLSNNKAVNVLLEDFWWHSVCVGMISNSLSSIIGHNNNTVFLGGLLHDIGKLALIHYDVEKYLEVVRLVEEEGCLDIEAERKVFATDHIILGSEIAVQWNLSTEIFDIITYFYNFHNSQDFKQFVAKVRIADLFAELWGASFHEGVKSIVLEEQETWKFLTDNYIEFRNLDIELFTFKLENDFKKAVDYLKLIKD